MRKQLQDLETDVLMELVNEMNSWNGYNEYLQFYDMGEINEFYYGVEPLEVLTRAYFGEFNPTDDYFNFNGYGNLVSYNTYEVECEIEDNRDEIIADAIRYHENGWIDLSHYINKGDYKI